MSKQSLSLQDDWEQLKKAFRTHFRDDDLEIDKNMINYSGSGEHLEIHRDGTVSGGMPLHENKMENVKQINISDSEIKMISKTTEYTFRR